MVTTFRFLVRTKSTKSRNWEYSMDLFWGCPQILSFSITFSCKFCPSPNIPPSLFSICHWSTPPPVFPMSSSNLSLSPPTSPISLTPPPPRSHLAPVSLFTARQLPLSNPTTSKGFMDRLKKRTPSFPKNFRPTAAKHSSVARDPQDLSHVADIGWVGVLVSVVASRLPVDAFWVRWRAWGRTPIAVFYVVSCTWTCCAVDSCW